MFKLEFSTDNSAFIELGPDSCGGGLSRPSEVSRILEEVVDAVLSLETSGTIQDHNGNTIGKWSLDKESE